MPVFTLDFVLRKVGVSGAVVLVGLALLVSRPASADEANDLFQKGAAAYREGRYEEAIELFRQAYRLHPYAELVYNTGQAHEKLGNIAQALESFREYLRLSPNASDRATVEKRIQALEARQAEKALADVDISSTPSAAEVRIDGRRVGQTPWTGKLEPGAHSITLTLPGYEPLSRQLTVEARGLDLELALRQVSSPDRRASAEEPSRGVEPLTLVVLGVGVAGLGGALGFELARRGAEDEARDAKTQVGHVDAYERMERNQNVARVLFGVGAAGIAVGGTLLYLDLTKKSGVAVGCNAACGARFATAF
jgi:tetratricopeptide (TPR) repeat protein